MIPTRTMGPAGAACVAFIANIMAVMTNIEQRPGRAKAAHKRAAHRRAEESGGPYSSVCYYRYTQVVAR